MNPMPNTANLPPFPNGKPPQPPPAPPTPDAPPPTDSAPLIVSATPVLSLPPLIEAPSGAVALSDLMVEARARAVQMQAQERAERLAELRAKFAGHKACTPPVRPFEMANTNSKSPKRSNGSRDHRWRNRNGSMFAELYRIADEWTFILTIYDAGGAIDHHLRDHGPTPRAAYRAACRNERLARHDTATLLRKIAELRTAMGMSAAYIVIQTEKIVDLKHQLANAEQAAEFATHLVDQADPKAAPHARSAQELETLRRELRLARSYLIPIIGPRGLPLVKQCECLMQKFEAEEQKRLDAERKLSAALQNIDDLRKAAGDPLAVH